MNAIHDIIRAINKATRIGLTTHVRPDGDALGATLGLKRILEGLGKHVHAIELAPIAARYDFMVHANEVTPIGATTVDDFDLFIVLDCGDLKRPPEFAEAWVAQLPSINIDHHKSNTMFASINVVDTSASSVGEMIHQLATEADWDISPDAAEALWIAIITDTGRFAYDNTSPAAMRAATALLEKGVKTSIIDHEIFQATSLNRLRVEARAMDSLVTTEDGRVAIVTLTRSDFTELGCAITDAEDIVNIPRRLRNVEVALFFCELPDSNVTKVGFRTVPPHDAAALCRTMDGGGHARAAGCSIDGSAEGAQTRVLTAIHDAWFA